MNTLEQLQAKRQALLAELKATIEKEAALNTEINQTEAAIRAVVHGDDRRLFVERMEQSRRADHEADQAQRAANAAALAAHQLRADGETEAARIERLRQQQNRIDAEAAREAREEENRRQRLAALR